MGSIYQRGEIYWIKYYRHGKPYRESSKTDKITKAQKLLKKREGEIAEGKLPGIYFDKVKFNDLAQDFLTDYRINAKDTLKKAERSVKYLKKEFGGMRAADVITDKIKGYIEKRLEDGLSNASINRELAALKRIFRLASQCTPPKVSFVPYIPMLKESNVRKGFFEPAEYLALKARLPEEIRPIITFAYHSGWRKSEILGLTWDRVDLKEVTARVDDTKNEESRTFYMAGELLEEIRALFKQRRLDCPWVFHRNGEPIKDFRGAWDSACIKAGLFEVVRMQDGEEIKVPTRIFHDFRRTAVRDMVRSHIPERVAMKISGHKTRSVFDRYNIVNDQDLKDAAEKKQDYHEKQNITPNLSEQKRGEVIPIKQAQGI